MPIDSVIHTNRHSIDRVLNAGVPVALVFWEPGRPIPSDMDAALETYARQYAGKALIAKVDARGESELLRRFQVTHIPAMIYAKNGQAVTPSIPASDAGQVRAWLDHMTAGAPRPAIPASSPSSASSARVNGDGRMGAAGRGPATPGTSSGSTVPITLTDANFAQVIAGDLPVLVDFWAPWCGPCRMVAPSIEQLAREFSGRAIVGKLNVDDNQMTAGRYNIMSIPSLLIFKRGEVVDQIVGAQPLEVLRQRLARHA